MNIPTVFLIDNDEDEQLLFSEAFRRVNNQVHVRCFSTGADALEELTEAPQRPALILVDIFLLDGKKLIEVSQNNPCLASLPVVILGDKEHPSAEEYARSSRINAFYTKPSGYQNLLKVTQELLQLVNIESKSA